MIPLIVIAGPTASGKTALGIEIAKKIGGEIISADSMQVYKEMNIGTAKPDLDEMQNVPHHLIDFLDIGEDFSVNDFAQAAHEIIKKIYERGHVPILVGGTGLYLDVVVNNIELSKESFNPRSCPSYDSTRSIHALWCIYSSSGRRLSCILCARLC